MPLVFLLDSEDDPAEAVVSGSLISSCLVSLALTDFLSFDFSSAWLFHLPLAPPFSSCPQTGCPAHLAPGPLGSLVLFTPLNSSATCRAWDGPRQPCRSWLLVLHPISLAPQVLLLRRLFFIWKPFKREDLAGEREALDSSLIEECSRLRLL